MDLKKLLIRLGLSLIVGALIALLEYAVFPYEPAEVTALMIISGIIFLLARILLFYWMIIPITRAKHDATAALELAIVISVVLGALSTLFCIASAGEAHNTFWGFLGGMVINAIISFFVIAKLETLHK